MGLMPHVYGKAPSLIGLQPRSTHGPLDEDRAVSAVLAACSGVRDLLPVVFGHRLIGWAWGHGDRSYFYRTATSGYTSQDDMIAQMAAGKQLDTWMWKRVPSIGATPNWIDLWPCAGDPIAGAYNGAAYTSVAHTDTEDGALWIGGNVSPSTKMLLTASMFPNRIGGSSTSAPAIVYDRVLTYEACSFNANVQQSMTNSVAAPRYNGVGQPGMKIFVCAQTATGATASNLTQLAYVNQSGSAASIPASSQQAIAVSQAAAGSGNYARCVLQTYSEPFLYLATGDGGARSITSFTTSAANTGTLCFVLAYPLCIIPNFGDVIALSKSVDIDAYPQVYDGACLSMLVWSPISTNVAVNASFKMGWT
jgi:hypothetical protein